MGWKIWITWWTISVSDIQDYFEYIVKKHGKNPSIRIYVTKIENRITFLTNTGCYLELLTPETIELLGSTKSMITKDEIYENLPHLETTDVVLVHCNIANTDYQQNSRILYTFVPSKSFGQLLDNSVKHIIFLKTFNS